MSMAMVAQPNSSCLFLPGSGVKQKAGAASSQLGGQGREGVGHRGGRGGTQQVRLGGHSYQEEEREGLTLPPCYGRL